MKKVIAGFVLLLMVGVSWSAEEIVVKTAYEDVEPKFIKHGNGEFGGLCIELMDLISRDTGIKFSAKNDFVPKKRYLRSLEQGEVDVLFGLKKDAEREKWLVFGEPMYEVRYIGLVNKDDDINVQSIDDIVALGNKNIVLTIFGAASADYLKSLKLNVDDGAKDVEAGIGKLQAKRGRLFVYQDLSTLYKLKKSKYKNSVRVIDLNMKGYDHYVVYSKMLAPGLIKKINASIVKLKKNGEWDKVTRKYLHLT